MTIHSGTPPPPPPAITIWYAMPAIVPTRNNFPLHHWLPGSYARLARRGYAPPGNFLKMVQFDAFWSIFCCNFVKKFFLTMFIFYIKIIDIALLRTIFRGIRAYSRIFVYCAIWCVLEYIFQERSLWVIYTQICLSI